MSVTPWEFRLLLELRGGETYRAIAIQLRRNPKAVERTFERLRDKLRPWGGGSKGGLVHWIDTHEEAWLGAGGAEVPPIRTRSLE